MVVTGMAVAITGCRGDDDDDDLSVLLSALLLVVVVDNTDRSCLDPT